VYGYWKCDYRRNDHSVACFDQERDEGRRSDEQDEPEPSGMKAHISMDSEGGIMHWDCSTAASVSYVHILPDLLYGGEKKVWGDAGYQGQAETVIRAAPSAQDMTSRRAKSKAFADVPNAVSQQSLISFWPTSPCAQAVQIQDAILALATMRSFLRQEHR
jgi:hypothetical protein